MTEQNQGPAQVPEASPFGPGTTGRVLVVTAPAQRVEAAGQGLTTLRAVAGVSPDEEISETGELDPAVLTNPQASVNFPDLGILVAGSVDRERADRIAEAVADPANPLQDVVLERTHPALQKQTPDEEEGGGQQGPFGEEPVAEGPVAEHLITSGAQYSREFKEGYQAALRDLQENGGVVPTAFDESSFTWGLQ